MLHGKNLIDGAWLGSSNTVASPDLDGMAFAQARLDQIDAAGRAARRAFRTYAGTERTKRAAFLNRIAEEIDALGDAITETAMKESGLPEARLVGERGRTTGQLRMFADLIESEAYLDVRIDPALPDRTPLPRPDLRLTHRPIGPVAVFGASNFPLAFSTAGGDTASALAAGCPVIVKGHGAHAGTAELVAQAIATAVEKEGLPSATFQLVQGMGPEVGLGLVNHPEICAVGFTGSLKAGRALYDQCHGRAHPIPFYGELGSINPVFCLPAALDARAAEIGAGWAASLVLGAGQFCTNPGVLFGIKGTGFDTLQAAAIEALEATDDQKMLTDGIHTAYERGIEEFSNQATPVTRLRRANGRNAFPAAFRTDAKTWLATPDLHHEVFGAAGILVECDDDTMLHAVAEGLDGQLTATLQMDEADTALAQSLLPILEEKAGRLLCNGFPTGVEVCSAMMHGGPYPASTDVRATSVGTLAIVRWLRPVSYQNFPQSLLHDELKS
ncbi:MAG: aldehyde dehydrogenase (NADP(+)) [Pseudomonadota bacterium]